MGRPTLKRKEGGGGGLGRALLEGEGGGGIGAVPERVQSGHGGCESGCGGGFWRLEMRLGLVLGYENAFGVESVQWGRGEPPPPPFKRFPGSGTQKFVYQKWRDQIFETVNSVVSHDGPLGLGGGGGGRVIGRSNVRLATGRRQVTWPPAPCVLPRLGKAVPTWEGDAPPPPPPRASFEQGGGGGEGVLDPKLGVPKMA